jgi:HAD superfamily hydrolase (TIGR01450 family)
MTMTSTMARSMLVSSRHSSRHSGGIVVSAVHTKRRYRSSTVASAPPGFTMHQSFAEIMPLYDAFIFDQYGVILDGAKALEGSPHCLEQLHGKGKKLVILSNSCAPSDFALAKLPKYGLDPTMFVTAVTSGEESIKYIRERYGGGAGAASQRMIWFTWDGNGDMPDPTPYLGLCGNVSEASSPSEATFILAHGCDVWRRSDTDKVPLADFLHHGSLESIEPVLEEALKYGLPLLCANPDYTVVNPDGSIGYMPGNIARRYEEMGGSVTSFGKPYVEHFETCLDILGVPRDRVAHVGDSLHHDIQGANGTGIASIFISSGIHAEELGVKAFGEMPTEEALRTLFAKEGQTPTHVLPAVRY